MGLDFRVQGSGFRVKGAKLDFDYLLRSHIVLALKPPVTRV